MPWPFGDKVSNQTLSDLITGGSTSTQPAPRSEFNVSPITTPQQEPMEVDTSSRSVAPVSSPDTIERRTFKVKYGLDEVLKKTKDEIYAGLSQGEEPQMREQAAAEIDKRKVASLQSLVAQTIKNKGSNLTSEEMSGLSSIVANMSQTTNPDTVFEEAYGKQFISTLDRTAMQNPDSFLNAAKQKYPEETAKILNDHGSLVTKREIVTTYLEDVEDELKHQGWLGWGWDQAKYMVPGYQDVQMRGLTPKTGVFAGGLLGENLEKQRVELLRLPQDQLLPALKQIVEPMRRGMLGGNPTLAADYLRSVLGTSTRDIILKDVALGLDVTGLGLGKLGYKAASRLVRGESTLLKDTTKAAEDMVQASADPGVSKSTMEAAAGDLEQSAVTRATANAVGDAKNLTDPRKRALEALSDVFRTDLQDIKSRPGRYGQDIVNRIEQQNASTVGSVLDTAEKISKVERLPEVMSNETSVRLIVDGMKDTYQGLKNTIIDTSRPYRENIAGNWFVDLHLGNADGTYFTQRSVAENALEYYGLKSGQIVEGSSLSKTKAAKNVETIQRQIANAEETVKKIEGRIKENKYSTPEKAAKDQDTLQFLKEEALPGYKAKLDPALAQRATVEQQGLGYYIKVTKPINETDDVVRDVIASTTNTKIPDNTISSFFNAWGVGKYRTPEETLSKAERQNRLIVTYTPSEIFKVLAKNAPTIQKLSGEAISKGSRFSKAGKKWEEFQRVLENGQELWDAETKQKGYFFKSPGELEEAYMSWFKRMPDQDEIAAYFEFKRGMEIDRVFRNIAEHRNQTRLGAETHRVISADPDGKAIPSPEFSGMTKKSIGGSTDNVAIIGERYGHEKVRNLGDISVKDKKEMQDLIDGGEWKYFEMYNTDLRPLKGYGSIGDDKIRYVLAKISETRDLDWNHIPRRGGGHVEYEHPYYIKQAKIKFDNASGSNWYEGDTTIMPMMVHKMAQDVAGKLDTVRKYLLDKNEVAARDYSNNNLHVEWKEVEGWFKGEKLPNGEWRGARLSLKEPIQVIDKNKSLVDVDNNLAKRYDNFRNGNKEGNAARQNRVQFSEERDAFDVFTLENKGTARNPLYNIIQADKVDPITSLNRGLERIAKSNFMDDYKTMSVEHWLQQAKNWLNASESEIRHSPFYYFREAKFLPSAPADLRGRLETAKAHIEQLIQQPSETAAKLHIISQKLSDATYDKLGPNSVLTPEWDLAKLRDPFKFIRTITYHAAMGLWSIPQYIVQSGNYSNILGIAGAKYAAPGTLGAQLHFWSRVNSNPEIIDFLDKMASKFYIPGTSRYKPGEFKEAFEEFKKTGFGNVGGEYAALDDPMNQRVVSAAGQTFLDASTFFVRNGERNSRYGAWYTAMKEFRDVKPVGRITEQDRADILQRADLLNINMSRASSSALHSGAMSVPTQFYTYQLRLTELMAGSRLTSAEKRRLIVTNMLLYGIPMGTGVSGIPLAGYMRQKMMENGYVVGDDFFSSTAMEGVLSAAGAVISGKGDPRAGTWYDFPERLGTKGFDFLGGINRSDKNFLDIIGGPAWSLAKGTWEASDGFWRVMTNLVRDDGDLFQPAPEDFIDPLRNISSVNSFFRTLAAFHTGRWISKKEAWLADTTPFQAVFAGIAGFKDQRVNDIQTMRNALQHQTEYEKEIEKQFQQEYRRGAIASQDGNEELATKFFTRAKVLLTIGGYPEDKISGVVSRAAAENQSILDKVTFDFYVKRPSSQQDKDVGMDALSRSERVKAKQRGEE